MISDKCSVVVNSCDKYEDAWMPFFKLAKKYWPNCPYRYYLNAERKSFKLDGVDVSVLNLKDSIIGQQVAWGKRIKDCLKRIDTPYVILFLEDFFLQAPVDQKELERCINLMEKDKKYTAIYFKQIDGFTEVYDKEPKYFLMSENIMYKLNLQAGLWRKADLEALIGDDDSPWSFEFVAQNRLEGQEKIFLCSRAGTHYDYEGAVFPYLTGRSTGYGIWTGKWLWNNDKLFKKNGIQTGEIHLQRFSRLDMFKYYCRRAKEVMVKKFNKK